MLCPIQFTHAQAGITSIINQLLLDDCPIQTEPPLAVCTPPVLETQADIDAFQSVEVVKGHLQIEAETDLDFSPFANLREIQGILYIQNGALSSINGFNNLESVGTRAASFGFGRAVQIENNPNLVSISGFQNLRKSTHPEGWSPYINILFNPSLTQINGFNQLDQAAGVSIRYNTNLTTVTGFGSLHTIDTGIGLVITNSAALSTLPSFANLTTSSGGIELYNLPSITSMPWFQNMTSTSWVRVHNLGISDLRSFNNSGFLTVRRLSITNNPNLTLISGFQNLRSIEGVAGDLYISDNALLNNVTGFNSLITNDPTDYISISDNPNLNCPVELFMLQDIAYSSGNLVNCATTPYDF
ncbi:MAG: hypothetical protein HKN85_00245 [Gammaproteobacteria bacterium]|nr:hypothetical protein [Gammaproteobacteria bacterium]